MIEPDEAMIGRILAEGLQRGSTKRERRAATERLLAADPSLSYKAVSARTGMSASAVFELAARRRSTPAQRRERAVRAAELYGRGRSLRHVGVVLGVSEHTVRADLRSLGVARRANTTRVDVRSGLGYQVGRDG